MRFVGLQGRLIISFKNATGRVAVVETATVQEGEKCNIALSTKRPVYQCSIGANSQHREQGLWSQLAKVMLSATAQMADRYKSGAVNAKIKFTTT